LLDSLLQENIKKECSDRKINSVNKCFVIKETLIKLKILRRLEISKINKHFMVLWFYCFIMILKIR